MATWTNASLVYNSGKVQKVAASDVIELNGAGSEFKANNLTAVSVGGSGGAVSAVTGSFSSNVSVGGNLLVTGDIISRGSYNVAVGDAFIDLLASNTTTGSAQSAGWTANIEAQTTAITATAFTIGVAATSNPVITVSSDPTVDLADNDIIQVSGSANGKNDGLYVILSRNATTITVKGIGLTAVSAQTPFARNQLVASTGETASVVRAKVAAFAVSNGSLFSPGPTAVSAGVWCYHTGETETSFTNSWTAITAVTVSLQSAYNGGNTINLVGGSDLIVNKPSSGNAAISLEANAASDITVDGAALTLDASRIDLNTGNVNFAKAGTVSIDTSAASEAGNVVYRASGGGVGMSEQDSGTAAALEVDGVVVGSPGASGYIATVSGTTVLVKFTSAPANAGDIVYLSGTAGQATTSLPGSGRIYRLGRVASTTAVGGLYEVEWNPQYIADV